MRSSFPESEAVLLLDEGVQDVVCLSAPPLIGVSVVDVECHPIHATQSISTRAPFGSAAT
jgi:hypothetical protein